MNDCSIPAALLRRRVYLLHFYDPSTGLSAKLANHAGHYCGMSDSVSERLSEHGTERGARLTLAARRAGLSWVVVKVWPGGRTLERALKSQKNGPRLCDICTGKVTLAQVLAAQPPVGARVIGKRVPMQEHAVQFYR